MAFLQGRAGSAANAVNMRMGSKAFAFGHHTAIGGVTAAGLLHIALECGTAAALNRHTAIAVDLALRRHHCAGFNLRGVKVGTGAGIDFILLAVHTVDIAIGFDNPPFF